MPFSTTWKYPCIVLLLLFGKVGDVCAQLIPDSLPAVPELTYPRFETGTIRAGYYYGLTPFAYAAGGPVGYFQGDANLRVNVQSLPFSVTGFYTTLRNITGLNNSIRVAFDAPAWKERALKKLQAVKEKMSDSLAQLQELQQRAVQHAYYLQHLKSLSPAQYTARLKLNIPAVTDSIPHALPGTDSLQNQAKLPAIAYPALPQGVHYRDSLDAQLQEEQAQIRQRAETLLALRNRITQADSLLQHPSVPATALPGKQLVNSIQSFQIGLCYPSYSPFLLSGIPLRGVQVELQRGRNYFAAACGKTVSNMLITSDLLRRNLNNVRNLYNFFDFNRVDAGRSIAVVKAGRGTKDGTHLYAGLLYGRGLQSYWQDSVTTVTSNSAQEKNWVAELDGRWRIGKQHALAVNYAKSVVKPVQDIPENPSLPLRSWLDYRYRSHALHARYEGKFPRLHSNLTATFRWIDPYFRSFGAGFVRQDNVRIAVHSDHQLGKKIRLGLDLRQDADNLLRLYDQYTVLRTAGINLGWKCTSRLQLRAAWNPVVQQVSRDGAIIYRNSNAIENASLSWRPKTGGWSTQITALYSYCLLSGDSINHIYASTIVNGSTQSRHGWRFGAGYAAYQITPVDTMTGNSTVLSAETGYTFHNHVRADAGLRLAQTSRYGQVIGWTATLELPLFKHTSLVLDAQRLVPGDFYNSYTSAQFSRFPYACSAQCVYTW